MKRVSLLLLCVFAVLAAALYRDGAHARAALASAATPRPGPAWPGQVPAARALVAETKAVPVVPVAQAVDALRASGSPEAAFEAYLLVHDCVFYQKEGWLPRPGRHGMDGLTEAEAQEERQRCAGLTPSMAMRRLDDLGKAVAAGVMGAACAYYVEGPFGDPGALKTRPDDPLVRKWKAGAVARLTRQADQGEYGALELLRVAYGDGDDTVAKNPALALRYVFALRQISDEWGLFKDGPSPYDDTRLAYYETDVPEDAIAAASAAAIEIKKNYDRNRQR